MAQFERLKDAYDAGEDLPILNGAEFAILTDEVNANSDLSYFDKSEILEACRFNGRGFGVDYSKE